MTNTASDSVRALPPGWRWVKLREVCEFESGGFLGREKMLDSGPFPVYGANGIVGRTGEPLFREPRVVLGRVGSCGAVNITTGPAWITDNTIVCSPRAGLDFDFLALFFGTVDFRKLRDAAIQPLLTQKTIKEIDIPLPPLPEQKRIARILNEQMTEVEKARAATEAQLEAAKALPAAYLREVFDSPEAWTWAKKRLGEIADIVGGNTLPVSSEATPSERVYCLKVSDLDGPFFNGTELTGGAFFTSRSLAGNRVLEKGAVVFPKRGGAIATNKKRVLGVAAVLDPNLMGVQPIDSHVLLSRYLYLWFVSWSLSSLASGNVIPQINRQDLAPLEIPLPAYAEQVMIAGRIDAEFHDADQTHRGLGNQLNALRRLPAALLRKAFKGEL
jgi:type I restriction enzyme S subunit